MITTLRQAPRKLYVDLGRAFGGAIIFALPMLMTMEMWALGFHLDGIKLALMSAVFILVLTGLSHYSGFEATGSWLEDGRDALVGYLVGITASAVVLGVFGQLSADMSMRECIGKIAIQAIPAGMGAILARSQFQNNRPEPDSTGTRDPLAFYFGELFIMVAGALFLAFNVAPTEEVTLLAVTMGPLKILLLFSLSLAAMHGFVYAADYSGQADVREGHNHRTEFLIFTVPGYLLALIVCLAVLWFLDRLGGLSFLQAISLIIVLGFPAAIGAAAARLIL